jgi:hypothetical protein
MGLEVRVALPEGAQQLADVFGVELAFAARELRPEKIEKIRKGSRHLFTNATNVMKFP